MSYYQQNSGHRKRLLGVFILLSLLVHGLVLMLPDRSVQNNHRLEFSSPIQVTVISSRVENNSTVSGRDARHTDYHRNTAVAAAQTMQQSKQETVTGRSSVDTARHDVKMVNSKPATVEDTPVESAVETVKETVKETIKETESDNTLTVEETAYAKTLVAAAETESQENLSLNHLLHQLRALIKARFTYPRMARRMGWEGLVALSLHIENDGSLHNVSIARSSGHKVLDENARSTVERIGRLQVASSLAIQAVDTEVEVLYRLTD